jgi:hypothetical protein
MTEREPSTGAPAPTLPRERPSWLVIAYGGFGALVLLAYFAAGIFGWSAEEEERAAVPLGVRQAPGGYRSYHLWHAGYQGGK